MASISSMKAAIASSTRGFICVAERSARFTRSSHSNVRVLKDSLQARFDFNARFRGLHGSEVSSNYNLRQPLRLFLSSFRLQHVFLTDSNLRDALQRIPRSLTQPLLDYMLYLTQYLYNPGTLPGSANRCVLENVHLEFGLSRKLQSTANEMQAISTHPIRWQTVKDSSSR